MGLITVLYDNVLSTPAVPCASARAAAAALPARLGAAHMCGGEANSAESLRSGAQAHVQVSGDPAVGM